MSNQSPVSGTAVLILTGVVFVTTVTATTILSVFSEDNTTIALLVAQLAPTIATIATLLRVEQTRREVNTALNGQMDTKIKDNVSETLEAHGVPLVHKMPDQRR